MREGEVLQRDKEESYITKEKEVYCIFHIFSENCLPSTLYKGGYKDGRRGRRSKQLTKREDTGKLKEKALSSPF